MQPAEHVPAFVVSFPKCGRTWLRLLLGFVVKHHFQLPLAEDSADLLFPDRLAALAPGRIPQVKFQHDDDAFFKRPRELTPTKQEYREAKVVFLVRDPRDVVISTYFHKLKRHNFLPADQRLLPYAAYQGDLSAFIREDRGSLATIVAYFSIWERNRAAVAEFLLVRYEDLMRDTEGQLRRVLAFLAIPDVAPELVDAAVAFGGFDHMRRLEDQDALRSPLLRPTIPGDADSYKTRRGRVGGYRDYLSASDIAFMNEEIGRTASADLFGYTREWSQPALRTSEPFI